MKKSKEKAGGEISQIKARDKAQKRRTGVRRSGAERRDAEFINSLLGILVFVLPITAGYASPSPDEKGQPIDITVEWVSEEKSMIYADLTLLGVASQQTLLFDAEEAQALLLEGTVPFDRTAIHFERKGLSVRFRAVPSGVEVFFETALGNPIALATSRRLGATQRYRLTLFKANPLVPDELSRYAEERVRQGYDAEAVRIWRYIQQKYPVDRQANYQLARVYFERGAYREAMKLFEKVIDLDQRDWKYPEARIEFARAQNRLALPLANRHIVALEEYIRYRRGEALQEARNLLAEARHPITVRRFNRETADQLNQVIHDNGRAVITFLPELCDACPEHLAGLFTFASRNPRIDFYVVAIDRRTEPELVQRDLNKWQAPYWQIISESSILFYHDRDRLLLNHFALHGEGHTMQAPWTLFLKEGSIMRSESDLFDWVILNARAVGLSR